MTPPPLQQEIARVLSAKLKPTDTLISRQLIESEIEENPGIYPALSGMSKTGRRRAITQAMNELFPYWRENQGVRRYTFVWKVRSCQEDASHPEACE